MVITQSPRSGPIKLEPESPEITLKFVTWGLMALVVCMLYVCTKRNDTVTDSVWFASELLVIVMGGNDSMRIASDSVLDAA